MIFPKKKASMIFLKRKSSMIFPKKKSSMIFPKKFFAATIKCCWAAALHGPRHLPYYNALVKYILLHESPLQSNIIIYLGKVGAIRQGFKKGI